MNYEEAVSYIHSLPRFGKSPGTDGMKKLLEYLGNPHKNSFEIVHIAGTNGKGSTSSFVSQILIKNNKRTGMFISPFVHCFTERIQINGQEISKENLIKYTKIVKNAIESGFNASQFEAVTAIGFLYFAAEKCDFVVLEVGLGGRFDATNVIEKPLCTAITAIGFDHMEYLGSTLPEIAYEKCGIIKEKCPVIAYCDNPDEVDEVIVKNALLKNAPVTIADKQKVKILNTDENGSSFLYKNKLYNINMIGVHQIYNAVTAIEIAFALGIDYETVKSGLFSMSFRGRLEILSKRPLILCDGAHNENGINALKNTLTTVFKNKKIIAVMGMVSDKQTEYCCEQIAGISDFFIATKPDTPRALDEKLLFKTAKKYCGNCFEADNINNAIKKANELYDENSLIIVCGSLYLLGFEI